MRAVLAVILASGAFGVVSARAAEPAAAERPVHRFVEAAVSPSGALVASIEGEVPRSGRTPPIRDLVIRRVEGGAATKVTLPCGRSPECTPGLPSWSADSAHLTFALRVPGSHARTLYEVAADGTGLAKVLEFGGTLEDLRRGPGGRLALLATADAKKEVGATQAGAAIAGDLDLAPPEQRIALVEGGALRFVSPPELFVYEYDWLPDGSGFVGTAAPGDGDSQYWVAQLYFFPIAGGTPRVIYAPKNRRQQLASPRVSRDGQRVAFIVGIMSDFGSTGGDVYTVPVAGGAATNVTPGLHASASEVGWGCDGRLRAELLSGDQAQLVALGDGSRRAAPEKLWGGTESWTGDPFALSCPSELFAVSHETFTAPPELEVGTVGHWHDLTRVNAGLVMPLRAKSLSWKSDSYTVQGWLLLPEKAAERLPLITVVHGGPAAAVTPRFFGLGLFQSLLTKGYALFFPNPRGSYGQGEKFAAANVRDLGHGDLRDVLRGIDAAEKAAPIDEARLALTGHSYGGFMTMWAITQTRRFKAAVAGAGISDWLSYYGENGINAWLIPYFGASVYAAPAVYARSSPINFVRNVRTPTYMSAGEYDVECPAAQTQEYWHALKELGVPTSSVIYPGEGHSFRDPAHLADDERRTLAWFDKYLE